MKIGHITIGERPLKIAECGLNPGGSLDTAFHMIYHAKRAGADVVKFQTFKADEFCKKDDPLYPEFKRGELPDDAWPLIADHCKANDIMFMSTPQNVSDLELLLPLGIPAIKIGADDACNYPLLEEYAKHGLPLVISTGMTSGQDQAVIVNRLNDVGAAHNVIYLLCTSQYPCSDEEARISRLVRMGVLHGGNVGFSDHTVGVNAAVMAVAYGATVFEKHFTLDHNLDGPDHSWACEPDELEQWCTAIDNAWILKGDPSLDLTPAEEEQRRKYQRRPGVALRGE